jgi:hypothetical protein
VQADSSRPSSGRSNLSQDRPEVMKTALKNFLSVSELALDQQGMLDFRIGSNPKNST